MDRKRWTLADVEADMRLAPRRERAFTATGVRYLPERREFEIRLDTGLGLLIPLTAIPEVAGATEADLGDVAVVFDAIEWNRLDVQLNTTGLIIDSLGEAVLRKELGRRAGSAKSTAKATASAANGKKGGRPRKLGA